MTYKQAAQSALDVQGASNLSGVAHSFTEGILPAIFAEALRVNRGTKYINTHPIVTLYLLKMAELNGCGSTLDPSYGPAEAACQKIAAE